MSLLDMVFGPPPQRYDSRYDRSMVPDPMESRKLSLHVRECAKRYAELREAIQDGAIEQHNQKRLLWVVIALLVVNKAIDVSSIAAFFAG